MFTGIIECVGTVKAIKKGGEVWMLTIAATPAFVEGVRSGDSIAINGVCLTVVSFDAAAFSVQAVEDTRRSTAIGSLSNGDVVNLEKAAQVGKRLDGHIVQGHVDGVAVVAAIEKQQESCRITVRVPQELRQTIIPKGSIAVDGISLTVQQIQGDHVTCAIIPHTFTHTNLSSKKAGSPVNVETDVIGKYVISFLTKTQSPSASLTLDRLLKEGF